MLVISDRPTDADVVIVGAGAAGVAAALATTRAGLKTLVLEARDRIGGRAHTVSDRRGGILDLGCEWLHSADRNPLVALAQGFGFTIDRSKPDWGAHAGPGFPPAELADFHAASDRFWTALEQAAHDGGPDRPAADLLEPGNPWNPLIDAISTYYNGVELDRVSLVDLDRYVDTGVNWRIAEGYGAFVARAAAALDIRTGSSVSRIDHSGPSVRVVTGAGVLTARAVIVTVPTSLLAAGNIAFVPDLPRKREAAAALPLGLADKVFFAVEDGADIPSGHLFGSKDRVGTISFDLRPGGRPLIHGFAGGDFARSLEMGGERAFEAEARAQLTQMLGGDLARTITFLRATAWDSDPFARGAYSHALPGCADMRATLAEPVDGRLFFAGEACDRDFFSTAHGAWQTGCGAAKAVIGQLARSGPAEPRTA